MCAHEEASALNTLGNDGKQKGIDTPDCPAQGWNTRRSGPVGQRATPSRSFCCSLAPGWALGGFKGASRLEGLWVV